MNEYQATVMRLHLLVYRSSQNSGFVCEDLKTTSTDDFTVF